MTLQVKMHTNSVSDINMDSEKVEGLCFPLLFPHGEPGYTNLIKSHLSPDEYVMAMMLRPEKYMVNTWQLKQATLHFNAEIFVQENYLHLPKISVRLKQIKCKVSRFVVFWE